MKLNTKIIVYIGLLSAISVVLCHFPHFPVLPAFPFLKIDFADVPSLFAAVTLNPVSAVIVELIKNAVQLPTSSTGFVGEISNFIVGSSFAVSLWVIKRFTGKNLLMKNKLLYALPVAIVIQTIVAMVSNYYVIAPMYFGANYDKIVEFVIYGALPFNLIKGALQSVAFYVLYRGISPYINKNLYLFK